MTAREWRIEADAEESLRQNSEDAVLVLRLGLAVSALRAAQRLTVCIQKASEDGPAERRDRMWAFSLALAYLHEIRTMLSPRFRRVRELAELAGAPPEIFEIVGRLSSGKSALGKVVARLRNQLVFHFDEQLVTDWVGSYPGQTVTWQEGADGTVGTVLHRASMDIVAANLLPGVDADTLDGRAAHVELMQQVLEAENAYSRLFEYAITGYLQPMAKLTEP